jgi:hypothetical protein
MNIPPVLVHRFCPYCGAELQDKGGGCWLCHESKSESNPYAVSAAPPSESSTPISESTAPESFGTWDAFFTILLAVCVVLTVLVGIGFAVQDQGMLIPFAIFVGPPYLITILRGLHRIGSSKPLKPASLFLTLMISAVATASVAILLAVGAVIVLFIMCLNEAGAFK